MTTISLQVEEELKAAENLSIQDYIRESQNIASLHHQIVDCDQVKIDGVAHLFFRGSCV